MVGNVLPQAFEDGADMISYSEFIIELAGGSSVLNIWPERKGLECENTGNSVGKMPCCYKKKTLDTDKTSSTHLCRTS